MTSWQRDEPFCIYLRRREQRRRRLVLLAYRNAGSNETSLRLAAKLAAALRVDKGSVEAWQR